MTSRRSFLGSILAAATPPGFVRAGVLMPVAPVILSPQMMFDLLMAAVAEHDRLLAQSRPKIILSPEAWEFYSDTPQWRTREMLASEPRQKPVVINMIRRA